MIKKYFHLDNEIQLVPLDNEIQLVPNFQKLF